MRRGIERRNVLKRLAAVGSLGALAGCQSSGGDGDDAGDGDAGPGGGGTSDGATATPTAVPTPVAVECDDPTTLEQSDVSGGTTLNGGCYRVENVLRVEGGTLKLGPGTVVQFASQAGFDVRSSGRITTQSTADQPAVLTGTEESRASWRGLRFRGGGEGSRLAYTSVRYAGDRIWTGADRSRAGIFVQENADVAIERAVVRGNGQAGIVAPAENTALSVSDTLFADNEVPAWVHANLLSGFDGTSDYRDNDEDAVHTGVTGARDHVTDGQSWSALGVPVRVRRTIQVNAPLSVGSGTAFTFDGGTGLDVAGGSLTVRGTEDAPVRFAGTDGERGSWLGVHFVDAGESRLEHAVVAHGGGDEWTGAPFSKGGVYIQDGSVDVTVENVAFENNAAAGLTADGQDATLAVSGCTFRNNQRPLRVEANLVDGVETPISFSGNDQEFLFVGVANGHTPVTEEADWPGIDVPYRVSRGMRVWNRLTITPGTTMVFEKNRGLSVRGTDDEDDPDGQLSASGTRQNPIELTGLESKKGYWRGVEFKNTTGGNLLKHVTVEYGGSSRWHGFKWSMADLLVHGGQTKAKVSVKKSGFFNSGHNGVSIGIDAGLGCDDVSWGNNENDDSYDHANRGPIKDCG
jgi:hypothetical protein